MFVMFRCWKKAQSFQRMFRYQYSTATNSENNSKPLKPFSDIPKMKETPNSINEPNPALQNFDPSQLYKFLQNRHEQLGPIFQDSLMGLTEVYTSNPSDVEAMVRREGKWPHRPEIVVLTKSRKLANMNVGILNAQGEEWYKVRKLYNEHLLVNKSIWMYAKQHLEISYDLMDFIKRNLNEENEVPDLENFLYRWALECATAFALDKQLGTFRENSTAEVKNVVDTTSDLLRILTDLFYNVQLLENEDSKEAMELKRIQESQINALRKFIKNSDRKNPSRLETILADSSLNEDEKEVVISDIMGVGIDTTANAASFALYCLAMNPEKQEILRKEIKDVLTSGQEITGKTLQRMKYLHAVNMEAQRLFPLASGVSRIIPSDMVLSGYQIPAGTCVFLTANIMNNRDSKYFKDPDSFIPERWLDRNQENRFVMPGSFGIGARMCPGRRFALQEVGCLTMALLSRYKIEYHHEPFEMIFRLASKPVQKPRFSFFPIEI